MTGHALEVEEFADGTVGLSAEAMLGYRLPLPFHPNDGGRAAAGFTGTAGDCVVRSIAIAAAIPYEEVYAELHARQLAWVAAGRTKQARLAARRKTPPSPRNGVSPEVYKPWLAELDFEWTPTMTIGSGTTVHLARGELPDGNLVVRCSKHLTAVLDGVVHDTYDPTRDGTRAVYGYWRLP